MVSGTSPSNSLGKSVTLPCSAPDSLDVSLGAAGFVSPGLSNLGLNRLGDSTSVAGALETDSVSAAWSVSGRNFCAARAQPPPAGGAAGYVTAVETAGNQGPSNSNSPKTVVAQCPAGKAVISGGAHIVGATQEVALRSLQRIAGGTAWRVIGHEVDGTAAPWRLGATAVCADVTTQSTTNNYVTGVTVASDALPLGSAAVRSVESACGSGAFPIGGGAFVAGASGQPPPPNVVLTRSQPETTGPSYGWRAEARETDPTSQNWTLQARVVCALRNGGPPA